MHAKPTMTDPKMKAPARRRVGSVLVPAAGLAAMAVSASALSALAAAFPEAGGIADFAGSCDLRGVDLGCGHGFGCFCHTLPSDGPKFD